MAMNRIVSLDVPWLVKSPPWITAVWKKGTVFDSSISAQHLQLALRSSQSATSQGII